jgi:AcrR family transcriptional regulator
VGWWQERSARLGRRRPRADGLTIERIVDEAIALVDADGLEALTVRGLAARFETGPASLYRHVASRDELLVLIVDHVLGEVELPSPDLPSRAQVEALASGLRAVLLRHPHLVPALPAGPLQGPNAVLGSERALNALLAGGFPLEVALAGYLVLLDYVLGSVSFDSARRSELLELASDGTFAFGLRTFLDGLEANRAGSGHTRDR